MTAIEPWCTDSAARYSIRMAIRMEAVIARYFPDDRLLGLRLGMPMAEGDTIADRFGRAFKNGRQRCRLYGHDGRLIELRTWFETIDGEDLTEFRKQIRAELTKRYGKSVKPRSNYATWYLDEPNVKARIFMMNDSTSCEIVMDLAHSDGDIGCARNTCFGDCSVLAERVG
jgi:hypothetical protein